MTANQMKATKHLEQIRELSKRIRDRALEIEALRYSASGVGAIRYDKEHVQTSPQNYMEMAIIDANEKEMENAEDEAALDELKVIAYTLIRQMGDEMQRTILEYYYLNGCTMTQISQTIYMSERQAYYVREDALESFGMLL